MNALRPEGGLWIPCRAYSFLLLLSLLTYYYRSLVTQTDPYLAKPYVDILLPEFTHQETLLFSQFLYSGELRYKEWGGAEELF